MKNLSKQLEDKNIQVIRENSNEIRKATKETEPATTQDPKTEKGDSLKSIQLFKSTFGLILEKLMDFRKQRNQKYDFDFLVISACIAIAAGKTGYTEIWRFVNMRAEIFKKEFNIKSIPSHDTYRRLFTEIKTEELLEFLQEFSQQLRSTPSKHVAIDGKTIRNSGKKDGAVHIISAFCCDNNTAVDQESADKKSNEMKAIPILIRRLFEEQLVGQGVVFTMDAMGTQKPITNLISKLGGEGVFALKDNHPILHNEVKNRLNDKENITDRYVHSQTSKGFKRTVTVEISNNLENLRNIEDFGKMAMIAKAVSEKVETSARKKNQEGKRKKGGRKKKAKDIKEERCFLVSKEMSAKELYNVIKDHWKIENNLHRNLDMLWKEDSVCIREETAAENMNIFKKIILSIMFKITKATKMKFKDIMERTSVMPSWFCETFLKIANEGSLS